MCFSKFFKMFVIQVVSIYIFNWMNSQWNKHLGHVQTHTGAKRFAMVSGLNDMQYMSAAAQYTQQLKILKDMFVVKVL